MYSRTVPVMLFLSLLFSASLGLAQKAPGIGYELVSEKQDGPTKTYTITFDLWSGDRDAKEISVTPKSDDSGLEILTPAKTWSKVKKGKHLRHSISVKNAGTETRTLTLELKRQADQRTDTKIISVLVAPQ
ncbi:MAG: hypothetical protein KF802_13525 [Bdellovibrionaceae bacterium]|nr:hypothetical protein [Pseudobdellovibrionaceae bacterium]MBX3034460.1 hypothetical protein [Pseudobdellovibrionaceae bacterium]